MLAWIYLQYGDYKETAKYSIRALAICRKRLEKTEFYYFSQGRLFNIHARIYLHTGDYKKALYWLNKELRIYENFSNNDIDGGVKNKISQTYNWMGRAYLRLGDYSKAIDCYQAVLDFQSELHSVDSPESALVKNNLGFTYGEMQKWKKAFEYYDAALEIMLKYFGEFHSDVMLVYYNMAYDYCTMKEYKKSLALIEKVIRHYSGGSGGRTVNLAEAYLNKARTHYHKRDFYEALDYYNKALDIQKCILFEYHPDIGETYKNIADVLCNMKNNADEALDNYEAAKAIFKKSLCLGNSRLTYVCERIRALKES